MQTATTHPWITFTLDLRQAPPRLWMLLADACAKCQFITNIPIKPDVEIKLKQIVLERSAQASTAIEGNTLSAEQIALLAKGELKLPPSEEYLGIEVQNILDSYKEINGHIMDSYFVEEINNDITDDTQFDTPFLLNAEWIKQLNAIVLARLKLDKDITPGEIRNIEVGVGCYLCPPAAECDRLLAQLCEWLDQIDITRLNAHPLALPILKAMLAHLYLVWIHPFADGNGRTARLIEHQTLLAGGVPETATHLGCMMHPKTVSLWCIVC